MAPERLQKLLSAAGVASRREGEKLIATGRVQVNGEIVTTLGSRADLTVDVVRVDGKPIQLPQHQSYLLLNKPRGYVCALKDPQGRKTVRDLLPPGFPRVFHVGRLDYQTEGLLILTDDGAFAQRVAHPRHGCPKVYLAKVSGVPTADSLNRLRRGVSLDGKRTAPSRVEVIRSTRRDGNTWLSLTLVEGRSREVRRMLQAVGSPVSKLKRVKIGPVDDRGLEVGQFRDLTPREIEGLRNGLAEYPEPDGKRRKRTGSTQRPLRIAR